MKSNVRMRVLVGVAVMTLALIVSGCKIVTTPQASANIHVSVEVQRYAEGNTHISIRFSDASNNTIEFVSGETVACDGQLLRYALGFYIGDVPRQADGGHYTITYTPARGSATPASSGPVSFDVGVVASVVTFTQPTSGATVAIPVSAPLTITYVQSALPNTSVYASATDSRDHITAVLPQGDDGSLTIPADNFSVFQAGPGTLSLARLTLESVSGTQFSAVDVQFKNITVEPIQWQ